MATGNAPGRVRQALHKGNAKLKSKLVAGFELDKVAGFYN
jgi:hypothetical protein